MIEQFCGGYEENGYLYINDAAKNGKLRKPGVVKKYTCLNTGYLNRSGDAVTIRVRKKEA